MLQLHSSIRSNQDSEPRAVNGSLRTPESLLWLPLKCLLLHLTLHSLSPFPHLGKMQPAQGTSRPVLESARSLLVTTVFYEAGWGTVGFLSSFFFQFQRQKSFRRTVGNVCAQTSQSLHGPASVCLHPLSSPPLLFSSSSRLSPWNVVFAACLPRSQFPSGSETQ